MTARIAPGMKIRLFADLGFFPEGTEGTMKEVRDHDERIWTRSWRGRTKLGGGGFAAC